MFLIYTLGITIKKLLLTLILLLIIFIGVFLTGASIYLYFKEGWSIYNISYPILSLMLWGCCKCFLVEIWDVNNGNEEKEC